MFTYLIIDAVFIFVTVIVISIFNVKLDIKKIMIVTASLILLTTLFDNLLIGLHLYSYNPRLIIGLHIGRVPIEDFAYPIVAAIIVPWLWEKIK